MKGLSKWAPRVSRLFALFVTSLLNDSNSTNGIVGPAALFLRVRPRASTFLQLICNPVSRHGCDSISSCSSRAVTDRCVGPLDRFVDKVVAVHVLQSLCVDTVEDRARRRALWKSHYDL